MTRLAGFLAAVLAAALAGGLCLLIGVVIGRDSRTPDYYHQTGWRDDPDSDDGVQPPDPWVTVQSGTIALPRVSTCGACLKRYTLAYQSQKCPHPFRVVA